MIISLKRQSSGFSLLELLVAMAMFATIAIIAYRGLSSMLNISRAIELDASRLKHVQSAVLFLERDLLQTINRPIREQYGSELAAILSNDQGKIRLEFTRGGRRNPAGFPRSTLQRVAYGLDDDKNLIRHIWPVLDRSQDTKSSEHEILAEVNTLEFRFLDKSNSWVTSWPPQTTSNTEQVATLPRAVEVVLDLTDWGRIKRLIVLPND